MTLRISHKLLFICILGVLCAVPSQSQAATTPDITVLQNQYQMLVERFETMKKNRTVNASSSTSTKPVKIKHASSTVDRTCMANAVVTRETAISAAWVTFSNSITNELGDRADELEAAWNGSEEGSQSAIKSAWNNWKNGKKAAHTELRNDRKEAWEAFKKTAKDTCKMAVPKEEGLEKSTSDSVAL